MPLKKNRSESSTPIAGSFSLLSYSTEIDFSPQDQHEAESLITACLDILSSDDLHRIKLLVEQSQVHSWVQDRQGWTALHAAAASGQAELCTFLLRKSNAVWNIVDHLGFTAGDIAYSMNNAEAYQVLLAEGIRAELLKAMMTSNRTEESSSSETVLVLDENQDENLLPADDSTLFVNPVKKSTASDKVTFLSSRLEFTHDSKGQAVALDEEGNGVMMGWEEPIMKRTAEWLCEPFEHRRQGGSGGKGKGKERALEEEEEEEEKEELVVLNIGFGLGIVSDRLRDDQQGPDQLISYGLHQIDTYLQTYRPTTHLIIEPHPDVLAFASSQGWFTRPNVRFFHGTWQEYQLALSEGTEPYLAFDAIYFDTYSEHYSDLHQFFDVLPDWLRDTTSRFSFFHGLGATSRSFYDVYTEVSEIHLKEIGLNTQWEEVEVGIGEGVWEATREGKKYWGDVGPFRMPKCRLGGMM